MDNNKKQTIFGAILTKIRDVAIQFWNWLMPDPADHWFVQVLKSLAKVPVVLLLLLCSPVLMAVLLIVFLIAL